MKKLLMLGGAYAQVPAIKKAKEMGHYVITCDYLPHNPGHRFSDAYYDISTIDKEAVLNLAKSLQIDGIVCYAADSGAPTVAYVAEKLGLSSFPYEAVEMLSNKERFRAFLKKNSFSLPQAKGFANLQEVEADFCSFTMPVMIKPVDSSGSRGVAKIDTVELLARKVEEALFFSRTGRFIMEEYIEKIGYQTTVECFAVDGNLTFCAFANNHFVTSSLNPFLPIGDSVPSSMPDHIQRKIQKEIQRLIELLDIRTGPMNVEVQVDDEENIYFLDIGVRNSGDLTRLIKYAHGIDLVEYTIRAALNESCNELTALNPTGYWASYAVISNAGGVLKGIKVENEFKECHIVKEDFLQLQPGGVIKAGENLGTMILSFSSLNEMLEKMDNSMNWLNIITKKENPDGNAVK